jgi:Zn-dependent protease
MTNALIEVGLISVSVVLGLIGSPIWVVAVMVGISLAWWGYVHHVRLWSKVRSGGFGALGNLILAMAVMILGHGVGYGLGGAFHAIMRIS